MKTKNVVVLLYYEAWKEDFDKIKRCALKKYMHSAV